MLSSKKIIYFIIISLLIICYANGIDYRSNMFEGVDMDTEIVDFSDSGFFAVSYAGMSQSLIAEDDEEGGSAVAYQDTLSFQVDQEGEQQGDPNGGTETLEGGNDQPDGEDVTDPGEQQIPDNPENTTTTAATTTTTAESVNTQNTNTQNTDTQSVNTQPSAPQQPEETPTAAPRTTTTTRATTTTTTTTTSKPTTTTTEKVYYDTGNVYFSYAQVRIYAGASTTVSLVFPIGTQRYATFASKDTSVASVRGYDDTTVEITGVAVGSTWIQAKTSSGDYAYCKVVVTDFAGEVIRLTNIERANQGIFALEEGGRLVQKMADLRLEESATYFNHTRPNGTKFYTAAGEVGLTYSYIGENLASGQTSPQQVIEEWMASPTHRANILNTNFTQICVAYGVGSDGYTYWVQIFYNPQK